MNVVKWSAKWKNAALLGLESQVRNPVLYRIIRYEDLIREPVNRLQELCDFLGITVQEQRMLSMKDFDQKENSSFDESDDNNEYVYGIRTTLSTERREKLSDRELNVIDEKCGSIASVFGYTDFSDAVDLRMSTIGKARFYLDQLSAWNHLSLAIGSVLKRIIRRLFSKLTKR